VNQKIIKNMEHYIVTLILRFGNESDNATDIIYGLYDDCPAFI
jgi:hypothetical protein